MTLRQLKVAAFQMRTVLSPEVEANVETHPSEKSAFVGAKRTLIIEHPWPAKNKYVANSVYQASA